MKEVTKIQAMSKELISAIKCGICSENLDNPVRLIECMHAYCKECLTRDSANKRTYKCRKCGSNVNPMRIWLQSRPDHGLQNILSLLKSEKSESVAAVSVEDEKCAENQYLGWICVKLTLRKAVICPIELSVFPNDRYFTVCPSMPVSTLAKLLKKTLVLSDEISIAFRAKRMASGAPFKVREGSTMGSVAERVGCGVQSPLELLVEFVPAKSESAKLTKSRKAVAVEPSATEGAQSPKKARPSTPLNGVNSKPVFIQPRPPTLITTTAPILPSPTTVTQSTTALNPTIIPSLNTIFPASNFINGISSRSQIQGIFIAPQQPIFQQSRNQQPSYYMPQCFGNQPFLFINANGFNYSVPNARFAEPCSNNQQKSRTSIFPNPGKTRNGDQQTSSTTTPTITMIAPPLIPTTTTSPTKTNAHPMDSSRRYRPILPKPGWVHSAFLPVEAPQPRPNRYRSAVMRPQLRIPMNVAITEEIKVGTDHQSSETLRLRTKKLPAEQQQDNTITTVKNVLESVIEHVAAD